MAKKNLFFSFLAHFFLMFIFFITDNITKERHKWRGKAPKNHVGVRDHYIWNPEPTA